MPHPTCPDLNLLRRVPYFSGLSDDVLAALAAAAVLRRYSRGQVIFLEGDACVGLHVVTEGEVKIFKLSPRGREQILHRLGPGETFNDVAVLDGGPNPASAAAITDSTVCVITRLEVRRIAHLYPALAWALIESIAHRARHLVGMVEDLSLRSVRARLARLLLAEAQRSDNATEINRSHMVTQADLAARLGTVRELIGRALRDLADEQLIAFDRHRIVIIDGEKLAAVAEGI